MSTTKQKIASVIVTGAVLVGGLVLISDRQPQNTQVEQPAASEQTEKPIITISDDQSTITYEGKTGQTALEVLRSGVDVTTEDSSFGEFVSGINGVQADPSSEYWAFYVDGEYASEGAGTYETTDGEQIMWVLEQL